jgi:hypothetical protein
MSQSGIKRGCDRDFSGSWNQSTGVQVAQSGLEVHKQTSQLMSVTSCRWNFIMWVEIGNSKSLRKYENFVMMDICM